MAENLFLSKILQLLAILIKYGYYDDPEDIRGPLEHVLAILKDGMPSKSPENKPSLQKRKNRIYDTEFYYEDGLCYDPANSETMYERLTSLLTTS